MAARLYSTLSRLATRRTILFLLALYMLLVAVVVPMAGARLEAVSGGARPLDAEFAYSPAEAYARLGAYGDGGRLFYLLVEITLDMIYPVVYGLFFCLALTYLMQRSFPAGHAVQRLVIVPVAAVLLDFFENAGLATLLLNYPAKLPLVAQLTSALTTLKWLAAIVTMGLLLAGVAAAVIRRVRPTGPAQA